MWCTMLHSRINNAPNNTVRVRVRCGCSGGGSGIMPHNRIYNVLMCYRVSSGSGSSGSGSGSGGGSGSILNRIINVLNVL